MTDYIDIMNVAGTDYPIRDSDAQQRLDDLKSTISGLSECALSGFDYIFLDNEGKFINNRGDLCEDGSTHTSNPVEIPIGVHELFVFGIPVHDGIINLGFYTTSTPSSNSYIGGYRHSIENKGDVKISVPNGAKYLVYSYLAVSDKGGVYYSDIVDPGDTSFFELENLFQKTPAVFYGQYYDENNILRTNNNYGQSDLIPVISGEKYSASNSAFFVNWYNASKAFLSSTPSSTFHKQGYATAVENAAFARFMFYMTEVDTFRVFCLSDPVYKLGKEFLPDKYFGSSLLDYNLAQFSGKKWVSFGDSITYRNLWQPTIAQLLGLTHTNCGIGSTSLSGGYMSGNTNLPSFWMPVRLNAVKAADPDIVTILGGANDVVQTGLTLGTETEFGYSMPSDAMASQGAPAFDPSGDYSVGSYCTKDGTRYECKTAISGGEEWDASHWTAVKNVDSFIGAYSYIVENLLTWKHNLCIVILGTTYGENDARGKPHGITYSMLSEASRKVARYYGFPFADLYGLLGYNKFTMGTGANAVYSDDQIHPNREGSKQFAKVVLNIFVNEVAVH